MRNTKFGLIFRPQRRKVNIQTNATTSVHLECFSIEIRQDKVHGRSRVCSRNLELKPELILGKIVHKPALSVPFGPVSIRFNLEPVAVRVFVELNVLNKNLVLFLQSLDPLFAIEGRRCCLEQGK